MKLIKKIICFFRGHDIGVGVSKSITKKDHIDIHLICNRCHNIIPRKIAEVHNTNPTAGVWVDMQKGYVIK